jgi:hypothetical protein
MALVSVMNVTLEITAKLMTDVVITIVQIQDLVISTVYVNVTNVTQVTNVKFTINVVMSIVELTVIATQITACVFVIIAFQDQLVILKIYAVVTTAQGMVLVTR